jgi:hypothetical protein
MLTASSVFSQETNSYFSGVIKNERHEALAGATVVALHEPTKNTFVTKANSTGTFHFFNLKPGGPYSIFISYSGYQPLKESDYFLRYSSMQDENYKEFILTENTVPLPEVTIAGRKEPRPLFGTETIINPMQMASLPSVSRNLQDYIRLVPQCKVNGEGMISLAGQPNRYNAFYIDGSNNNDLLGTAAGATNGGPTASPPISMEAIEEIKILLSPYDVLYSNFTGGSINVITRSGSNQFKSSAWYFFRNEQMAGRSPIALPKPGSPGMMYRPRLSHFINQTAGIWVSGALKRDELFYFCSLERQNELQPQPFNFSEYRGNSSEEQIEALADTMRARFNYEPGSSRELKNKLDASRFLTKLDWNLSSKNKLTLSYRYNHAARTAAGTTGSTAARFSNNAYRLGISTHTASLEWNTVLDQQLSNHLLLTFTKQLNERVIRGRPFPTITIFDGPGTIYLGSNSISQVNFFRATEVSFLDVVKFTRQRHVFTAGIDLNFSSLRDLFILSSYGSYEFQTLDDFLSGSFPLTYQRTVPLGSRTPDDYSNAGAKFNTRRVGFFFSDDLQVNSQLKVTAGCRIDGNSLPMDYQQDSFFNSIARPRIEQYYDLEGAMPGQVMKTHWQLSPRIGLVYQMPGARMTIRGGAGIFAGHILNLWASGIYNVNTAFISVNPALYGTSFNPDPFNQPGFSSLGLNPQSSKGFVSLVARKFKYPTAFRTSLGADKKLNQGWSLSGEAMFTKNIHEIKYTNVNITPPDKRSASPGSRNVYATGTASPAIPMNGGNPYNSILLLSNNKGRNGYSYSATAIVSKTIPDKLQVNAGYTYSRSVALYEPTGNANGNTDQWEQRESVNGKNYSTLSTSDYDLGHRVTAGIIKRFVYKKSKLSTLISIFYEGQSGTPYSYVYTRSIVNDNGRNRNADLVYIPTTADLANMIFLPNTLNPNTTNEITYTPQKQKELLDQFIEKDKYLRKHRGSFAERNGARLPFSHVIDLRLQQDFIIRVKKKALQASLIYDIFNVTNLLNKKWGRTYILPFDNFQLIQFAGFVSSTNLAPQYKYTPVNGNPWSVQSSAAPGSSARWISQLGFRINFN